MCSVRQNFIKWIQESRFVTFKSSHIFSWKVVSLMIFLLLPCMLFQATTSSCVFWKAFPIYYWGIILYVKKVRDKPPQRESLIDYKLNNALSSIHPKPFNSVLLCMPLFPTKIRREGKSNAIIFHAKSGQLDLNTIDAWYVVSKMSVIFLIIL